MNYSPTERLIGLALVTGLIWFAWSSASQHAAMHTDLSLEPTQAELESNPAYPNRFLKFPKIEQSNQQYNFPHPEYPNAD